MSRLRNRTQNPRPEQATHMIRPKHLWIAYLATGVIADIVAAQIKQAWTFSAATREVFKTDTPAGKAAFLGAWATLTNWYPKHVLNAPTEPEPKPIQTDRIGDPCRCPHCWGATTH